MIPAVPLDGGRALHAVLWRRWHDFARNARGLAMLILVDPFRGAWLVFLGWFLRWAADAEALGAEDPGPPLAAPAGVAFLTPPSVSARATLPVVDLDDDVVAALRRMRDLGLDHALVRDDGRIVGALTLGDVARVPAGGPAPGGARRRDAR